MNLKTLVYNHGVKMELMT